MRFYGSAVMGTSKVELYEVLDEGNLIGFEFVVDDGHHAWHTSVDLRSRPLLPIPTRFKANFQGFDAKGQTIIDGYEHRLVWSALDLPG